MKPKIQSETEGQKKPLLHGKSASMSRAKKPEEASLVKTLTEQGRLRSLEERKASPLRRLPQSAERLSTKLEVSLSYKPTKI